MLNFLSYLFFYVFSIFFDIYGIMKVKKQNSDKETKAHDEKCMTQLYFYKIVQ
jgi:hypothetical protein